ncbi:MAG: hypothetical protein IPG96_08755 [Proteobacteria bacterium]|nr:hypothetical protein [Pseudomonadota bacterium]
MSHGRLDIWAPLVAFLALLGAAPACRPPLPEAYRDPRLGRGIRMFEGKYFESMTFSADGSLLLVELGPGPHDDHSLVRLFDTASLRMLWQAQAYAGAFDPAGTHVALLPEGEHALELREARTGVRRWRRSAAAEAYAVAFVGSRRVAVGGTRGLGVFDAADGRRLALLPIAGHVWAIASARDGRSVALLIEQRRSAPVCGSRTEAHVLELDDGPGGPRARTRCQVSTKTTLRLSSNGGVLAVDATSGETLLIDARSCRALVRTCALTTSTDNGRLWLTHAERAGTMRFVALDLNASGWRDGPADPWPPE